MKNRVFAFLFLLIIPVCNYAQNEWIQEFDKYDCAEGKERVAIGNHIMEQLYKENFVEEKTRFSRETPTDSMDKKVFFVAAEYCFYELGTFPQAISLANKAVDVCRKSGDSAIEGECQSILAIAYFRQANYPKALHHAHRDLELQRACGNSSNMSSALNTLAGIYLASKQYEEALKYINEAIPLSTAAGDSSRMAIQMGMATEILQSMHRSEEALAYARKAYAIDSMRGNMPKAAIRLSQMVSALMDLQRNVEAESKLKIAIPVLEKAGNRQSLAICHNQMGELLNRRGANKEAYEHFSQSLPFFSLVGDKYNEAKARQGAYESLRHIAPEQAMQHLEKLSQLKDSLYSIETKQHLSMAYAKYHTEELLLQNAHERKVKNLTLAMSLAVVMLLLALLGGVFYALRSRKRRLSLMQQLQSEKEMFFTSITHEFRTPLTIILGLAQRLHTRQLDKDETPESVAGIIDRQGKTLLDLVNQLLDMARTDRVSIAGDYRVDDVVGFVHMVVESCEELARRKHIALQYVPNETRVKMKFVPDYLQKIVQNLVSNALKFTPDYGNVRVVSRLTADGKHFQLTVSDNGEGISQDMLPYVFETFTGRRGTNGEVSTGVGLALVKKMVEALGGSVSVSSQEERGSTFTVILPYDNSGDIASEPMPVAQLQPAATPLSITDDETAGDNTNENLSTSNDNVHSILIVEDNVDVYYYMEHVLKNENYALFHARNGEEGLEKAQAIIPDLVVTDVMMPIMDGFEMCRQLKLSQVTNHIPVIVVTARNSESDKLRGLDCGAACYLSKPFRAEELLTQVRNIFEQRRVWREKFVDQMRQNTVEFGSQQEYSAAESLFLTKVNDYIFAHMEEGPIGVEALSLHMCMSPKQLNRKLPNIVGYSVSAYIAQQRISRACRLLQSTEERINVIAQKCGFDNPSNFSRTFKDTMNCSPSEWRYRGKSK